MIFNRLQFSDLWITLDSNEILGQLDTHHVEDYYGVDGQLILVNSDTNVEYPILMNTANGDTSLVGSIDLSTIPNGDYVVKGRVRDLVGNYTVLSDYVLPNTGNVVNYTISIIQSPTYGSVTFNGMTLMGGVNVPVMLHNAPQSVSLKVFSNESAQTLFHKDAGLISKFEGNANLISKLNGNESVIMRLG